jgi:hypothetical protein
MSSKRFDVAVRLSERPGAHKGRFKDSSATLEVSVRVLCLMNGIDLLTLSERLGGRRSASKALSALPRGNPMGLHTRRIHHRRSALTAGFREAHRRPSAAAHPRRKMGCLHQFGPPWPAAFRRDCATRTLLDHVPAGGGTGPPRTGPLRPALGELHKAVDGISDKMLTQNRGASELDGHARRWHRAQRRREALTGPDPAAVPTRRRSQQAARPCVHDQLGALRAPSWCMTSRR